MAFQPNDSKAFLISDASVEEGGPSQKTSSASSLASSFLLLSIWRQHASAQNLFTQLSLYLDLGSTTPGIGRKQSGRFAARCCASLSFLLLAIQCLGQRHLLLLFLRLGSRRSKHVLKKSQVQGCESQKNNTNKERTAKYTCVLFSV